MAQTTEDILARVHVLTHEVAGEGFLLAQDIRERLKGGRINGDTAPLFMLKALLPCLEEFVRAAHALADLDGEAWPSWWPKDWLGKDGA